MTLSYLSRIRDFAVTSFPALEIPRVHRGWSAGVWDYGDTLAGDSSFLLLVKKKNQGDTTLTESKVSF